MELHKNSAKEDSFKKVKIGPTPPETTRKIDTTELKCNLCSTTFQYFNLLIAHLNTNHDLKYNTKYNMLFEMFNLRDISCSYCGQKFVYFSALSDHVHKEHSDYLNGKEIQPEEDSSVLKKFDSINAIITDTTAIPFKRVNRVYRCFYCSSDFKEAKDLLEHTISHPANLDKFKTKVDSLKQMKLDIGSLSCRICNESCVDFNSIVDHLKSSHDVRINRTAVKDIIFFDLRTMSCGTCNGKFTSINCLMNHAKVHHGWNILCAKCGNVFGSEKLLAIHDATHKRGNKKKRTPIVQTTCEHCHKKFRFLKSYIKHVESAHKRKKMYKCKTCQKKFVHEFTLERHMKLHVKHEDSLKKELSSDDD